MKREPPVRDCDNADDDLDVIAECELDEPCEMVYRALTEPDVVDEWLGHGDDDEIVERELVDAEPHRLVRYSWRSVVDGRVVDSTVTFTLDDVPGGGTRLRVVHDHFVVREVVAFAFGARATMRRAA